MEIVREIRLSEEDRLALKRAFEIADQIAVVVAGYKSVGDVLKEIENICEGDDEKYEVPEKLEMEIFD